MPLRSVSVRGAARPFPALAALTATALALAACGDSPTGGSSAAPATLSIVLAASAGSASSATLDDGHLALAPGDSARLTATLRDARGGARTPSGLTWSVVDRAVAD